MQPEPHSSAMINTVASNESNYTTREIKQAKAARDLQRRLGNPTDSTLCKALSQGYIISKDVVPSDITRAHTIYGPNTEGLKGRTTKKSFRRPDYVCRHLFCLWERVPLYTYPTTWTYDNDLHRENRHKESSVHDPTAPRKIWPKADPYYQPTFRQ